MQTPVDALDDQTVEAFRRDGAVLLRGVFTPWVEGVREAIEQNKAAPSWRERTYRPDDGGAQFFQDYCVWSQFDGYRALTADSTMGKLAAQLMGSKTARIFHDHVLVKEPGNSVVTPWHQDRPYYLVTASQTVSFWVPLDPIPRERSWSTPTSAGRTRTAARCSAPWSGSRPDVRPRRSARSFGTGMTSVTTSTPGSNASFAERGIGTGGRYRGIRTRLPRIRIPERQGDGVPGRQGSREQDARAWECPRVELAVSGPEAVASGRRIVVQPDRPDVASSETPPGHPTDSPGGGAMPGGRFAAGTGAPTTLVSGTTPAQ